MGSHSLNRLRTYRPDITGLRALAILMVVNMHLGLLDIHGGVDVSFVLSGFLNVSILLREFDKKGTINIRQFFARRFRRLVPGAVVVILVTLFFVWKFTPLQFKTVATDGTYAAMSILNWRLVEEGTDYFAADGTQTPFQHYWSLCIEEQFYLVMPLVLLALAWVGRRVIGSPRLIAGFVLLPLFGWSFYECLRLTTVNQPSAYFSSHTRVWELGAGMLLALCAVQISRMNQLLAAALSWAGLAVIISTGFLITEETPLPGVAVLGPVLGTCMVIAGGCAAPKFGADWLLGHWSVKIIADNSYAWYLTHWPVLLLWEPVTGNSVATVSDKLRVTVVSFLLAALLYYPIMKRFQVSSKLTNRPHFSIGVGSVLTTSVAGVAFFAATFAPLNIPTATAAGNSSAGTKTVQEAAAAQQLSSTVQPVLVKAPEDKAKYGCIDGVEEKEFKARKSCVLGDKTSTRTVVLFGDSHAWHWGDAYNEVGRELGLRVVMVSKGGCSAGAYTIQNPQLNREYTECTAWRASALDYIADLHPDMVVVSSRIREVATKEGIDATFTSLKATGARLVYMTDTPRPESNVPDCLATHASSINECAWSPDKAVGFLDQRSIERWSAQRHGAEVIDVVPEFCTKDSCPVVIDNKIVFYDDSHMTATFSRLLAPWLAPKIKAALR